VKVARRNARVSQWKNRLWFCIMKNEMEFLMARQIDGIHFIERWNYRLWHVRRRNGMSITNYIDETDCTNYNIEKSSTRINNPRNKYVLNTLNHDAKRRPMLLLQNTSTVSIHALDSLNTFSGWSNPTRRNTRTRVDTNAIASHGVMHESTTTHGFRSAV